MELRDRNKRFGIPSSIGNYHPTSQELNNNQALNHLLLHQNLDLPQQQAQRLRGNQNPDLDPPHFATNATTIDTVSVSEPPPPPPHPPTSTTANATATATTIRYGECQKNHAASIGSHIVDGCGEFMPSGEDGTPESLKCAACDCHRSFHKREVDNGDSPTYPPRKNTFTSLQTSHPAAASQQLKSYHQGFAAFANGPSTGLTPPIMVTFGGTNGAPAESSSEDLNMFQTNAGTETIGHQSKKRFRTKFNHEQKDKMHEFAERIGWKIQKQNEEKVQEFCNASGVKRQVFKVWMHNNRQALKKKQL